MLPAYGVAASAVQRSSDLYHDTHLRHRRHFVALPHEIHGTTWVQGSRSHLSRTPARIERAAPTFGRDNVHVLETILGYDSDRIAGLGCQGCTGATSMEHAMRHRVDALTLAAGCDRRITRLGKEAAT